MTTLRTSCALSVLIVPLGGGAISGAEVHPRCESAAHGQLIRLPAAAAPETTGESLLTN